MYSRPKKRRSAEQDHYEILGIRSDATRKAIRRAYRREAKKVHPDAPSGDPSGDAFRRVKEAYDLLSDPDRRRAYDRRRSVKRERAVTRHRPQAGDFTRAGDFLSRLIRDILKEWQMPGPRRVEARVDLTADQARRGGAIVVRIPKNVSCEWCKGGGKRGHHPCLSCDGKGWRRRIHRHKVTVPAGVSDGTVMITEAKLEGGQAVELVVKLRVRGTKSS